MVRELCTSEFNVNLVKSHHLSLSLSIERALQSKREAPGNIDLLEGDGMVVHDESYQALGVQHTHHIGKQLQREESERGKPQKSSFVCTFMFLWQKACMRPEVRASLCSFVNRWWLIWCRRTAEGQTREIQSHQGDS